MKDAIPYGLSYAMDISIERFFSRVATHIRNSYIFVRIVSLLCKSSFKYEGSKAQ